jgi:hypothetical protein
MSRPLTTTRNSALCCRCARSRSVVKRSQQTDDLDCSCGYEWWLMTGTKKTALPTPSSQMAEVISFPVVITQDQTQRFHWALLRTSRDRP